MPNLEGIVYIPDYSLCVSRSEKLTEARENLNRIFGEKYPKYFRPEHVSYHKAEAEDLALINYTSGTTSNSKGVLLPYRALWSNVEFGKEKLGSVLKRGDNIISMLPMAHMYGMAFEFLYPFVTGCHIFFLGKTPTPSILIKALAEVKPYMLVTVPLVVEKIFKGKVMPTLNKPHMKLLTAIPGVNKIIYNAVRKKLLTTFGGNLERGSLIVGGAAINEKVERLMKKMNFPYTVGYGMTECAPLICYRNWKTFAMRSCGQKVERVEVRIDSEDPRNVVGEIQIKGDNVMMGYYKNPDATKATFTEDGWLKSGDLGVIDADGNVFIKGRSKNMILSASGQNVYPEEIEDKFNSLPLVTESIVISRGNRIVAIVVPDMDAFKRPEGNTKSVEEIMNEYLKQVNAELPAYSRVSLVELREEPFEKTPKRSIKRFLYS
jgi:long-chain acyl-CoA synthetase